MNKIIATTVLVALSTAAFGHRLAEFVGGQTSNEVEPPRVAMAAVEGAGPRIVALGADSRGHFITDIQINGQFLRTLVDTGASVVALSDEDARKIGLKVSPRDYTATVSTANGLAKAAVVRISELRMQSLVVRDVEAMVMPPGALRHSLLGMSFLRRLASFEMQGKTLVLRQ